MAIQFSCPSCRQPIEVDDSWAGQSVGCPYCRHVVTAPQSTEWPGAQIPMANPAQNGVVPPPPPPGMPPLPPSLASSAPVGAGNAVWSLGLAVCGAGLSILGWIICFGQIASQVMAKLGPNATQQQFQQAYMDMLASGKLSLVSPAGTVIFLAGTVCGICAIWLAIRALLRQERGRGMAIASCVIAACFTFCQVMSMLAGAVTVQAGTFR
ncbi:MAG TPA: hypothetical protein PKY77_17785 [Phycisphaerae bacterium]|nr:hypothetical protein [Phycisphaerae bacterium]HRY68845.1 hypothetical protein [Phycisphaerae bacterium]HSA27510.1 hypothetical protein [Phycisphaerae bacterium]